MRVLRFGLLAASAAFVAPAASAILVAACGETSGSVIAGNDAGGTPSGCDGGPTCAPSSADSGGGTSPAPDASTTCSAPSAPIDCSPAPVCVDGQWTCPDAGGAADDDAGSPDAASPDAATIPPNDAGTSGTACTTESDCPTGSTCGYLISLGCAATGTCVTLPPQMPCGAQTGCSATACDGGTITWATYPSCDPEEPKGYAPAAINGTPQEPGIGTCPNY